MVIFWLKLELFSQPPTMNYTSVTLLVGVWFTSLLDASLLDIVVYEERMFDVLITCLEEELSTGILVIVCEATGIVESVCEVRSAEDVLLKCACIIAVNGINPMLILLTLCNTFLQDDTVQSKMLL